MTKDLLINPTTRGVTDIEHVVVAAASSSSKKSAESFVAECVMPMQGSKAQCSAYGSYEELVKDPNVDLIYVGTPHSHHYQNCMLALTNGKPVLCEKAITVNAAQTRALVEEARKRKLFLMEAEWTRFFPLSVAIRKKIQAGDVGEVLRVSADLSTGEAPEIYETSHRNVNKDLAGGALLDLGVYSLLWLFQVRLSFSEVRSDGLLICFVPDHLSHHSERETKASNRQRLTNDARTSHRVSPNRLLPHQQ